MARLIYSAITSLDGYVNDEEGSFDWAKPDEHVHRFVNDRERELGTFLYGRRVYEVMLAWETLDTDGEPEPVVDYAEIWRAADKVVFSSTLTEVPSERTRLVDSFDPEAVRELVAGADRDVGIGGPTLASAALGAGLVDELHQYVNPVVVGGGTSWLPDGLRLDLRLVDEHRFPNGVVHLHYTSGG